MSHQCFKIVIVILSLLLWRLCESLGKRPWASSS